MNLRPGIDTHPVDYHLIAKLNLPFDDRATVIAVLEALEKVRLEKMAPERAHGTERTEAGHVMRPRLAVGDLGLNLLVGFGLRFFLGPLEKRTPADEEAVPNFPPGGTFHPRPTRRFDLKDRNVPLYLRTMNASGDRDWLKKKLTTENAGKAPTDEKLDVYYKSWLSSAESDLFLIIECDNRYLTVDFWNAVCTEIVEPFKLELVSIQDAFNRGDGRDHTGFVDGTSNLQERMISDPLWYRSKIYLPHPAPGYPGEPDWSRDDPRYDGGTYLVHRKYRENLALWFSDKFKAENTYGETFHGCEGRLHAVGRDLETGNVVSRMCGALLEKEVDSAEVNLGYNESHALKARGGVVAPFAGPFPPLKPGESNVFNTQDIRIKRRGAHFCEIDPKTGRVDYGLHFICFQNNIQQTGFEFINNIWLLNPLFRRSKDELFNPDSGIIEPLEGAYYFVPPPSRTYPGEVFFV